MRKGLFLSLVLIAILVVSSIAATTTITLLIGPDTQGFYHKAVQLFEQQNPDIHVQIIEGPNSTNDREQMFMTASMAKTSPYDVIDADIVWIPALASKGWLLPLDQYVDINQLYAENFSATVSGGMWDGKLYRIPFMSDAGLIYYRKDLLEKAGLQPPQTFEELFKDAQQLQDPSKGLWGFVYEGAQYEGLVCFYLEWLWGNGGNYYNPATKKIEIDSPQAIQTTQYLVDTIWKYKITPPSVLNFQEEDARAMFESGNAVFLRNWPYVWVLSQTDSTSKVVGKVGIIPEVHAPGLQPYATQGGWGMAISAFIAKDKIPAAVKLAMFFNSYAIEKLNVQMTGVDVSRRDIYYDPEVLQWAPYFKDLRTVLENTNWRPAVPFWPQLSSIMSKYLTMAMTKQLTPEQANAAMQKEAQQVVDNYYQSNK